LKKSLSAITFPELYAPEDPRAKNITVGELAESDLFLISFSFITMPSLPLAIPGPILSSPQEAPPAAVVLLPSIMQFRIVSASASDWKVTTLLAVDALTMRRYLPLPFQRPSKVTPSAPSMRNIPAPLLENSVRTRFVSGAMRTPNTELGGSTAIWLSP